VACALVNARMRGATLAGWARWHASARKVLGELDLILAADTRTAKGLSDILQAEIQSPGNLKSALPPPSADSAVLEALRSDFIGARACLVAASTHPGEEALVLKAWQTLAPRPALILVPRHPERGRELASLVANAGHTFARRSAGPAPRCDTEILIADTMGEMGLWYRLADLVYLGGGHARGVGGHNPLEPVALGRLVVSGPGVENFQTMMQELAEAGALVMTEPEELAYALAVGLDPLRRATPDKAAMEALQARAEAPIRVTLAALRPFLPERAAP